MEMPLYERLRNYADKSRVSFAMPGHKQRTDFSLLTRLDTTELAATADLHAESESVERANALLSKLYRSKRSFILSGGSTTAIHAMIAAAVRPGETLLMTPDCHMSVINICAVMGINIRVADTEFDDEFAISRGIKSVLKYLNDYPDIRAVLITSPTYYGVCSDIKLISEECHMHGKPLIVDEAHGAHFIASDSLPDSSSLYADLVCHSAHKTLNALTGAAYLHVRGDLISPERVRRFINIFESSSPSYVIAASADTARAELENSEEWDKAIALCEQFKERIRTLCITPFDNNDPTRIVLSFKRFNTTGYEIETILSEKYGIDIEMADMTSIVLIVTPKNTADDLDKLYSALKEITDGLERCETAADNIAHIPRGGIIRPQSALFSEGEEVEFSNSAGRISRATITAYPPGTPVIFAGETITDAHIGAICQLQSAGAKITGMNKNMIDTVNVKWKN